MLSVCENCSAYICEGDCADGGNCCSPAERACSDFGTGKKNVWSGGRKGTPDDCSQLTEPRCFQDGTLCRMAEKALAFPIGSPVHRIRVLLLPAKQHEAFRRLMESRSDEYLWLPLTRLRQGALCRRLLWQEAEGLPPPEGVFVSAPRALLPEDAQDLCPAMEYYFRFALPPSLFCILTDIPGLAAALSLAWSRFAPPGAPPVEQLTAAGENVPVLPVP